MGWSKAQWIQGKWLILLTESLLQVSGAGGSARSLNHEPRLNPHRQYPFQAGCSPTAPEQSTGAGSTDCPRQGKAMKQVQHPSRESSQEQKGTGAETGVETRLQHGSKVNPGGIAKDMAEGKLQGGSHPGVKLCAVGSDVGLGHRARAGVTPQCGLGGRD